MLPAFNKGDWRVALLRWEGFGLQLLYFGMLGHESCDLIAYLQGIQGVPPITPGYNPATWMLEVTGGATSTTIKAASHDFPALYQVSLFTL
jgi:hypothetical protein